MSGDGGWLRVSLMVSWSTEETQYYYGLLSITLLRYCLIQLSQNKKKTNKITEITGGFIENLTKLIENSAVLNIWTWLVDFLDEHWFVVTATPCKQWARRGIRIWQAGNACWKFLNQTLKETNQDVAQNFVTP